ncbi:hypothetical protein ABK040_005928 [Willaertia magna]
MSEDLDSDIKTNFTNFDCYFDNQEGVLQVAGHVVIFKGKYSDRQFDIPINRIKVFKSKKEPKLRLDKKPAEEEGRATERNTENFLLTFTNSDACEKCKDLIAQYINRVEKRKRQSPETIKQLKLLASDPTLKKLFDELVGGGILSKEEFWAQRKHLISSSSFNAEMKPQRPGLKNYLFCSDDSLVTAIQKSGDAETTISLTPRKIQQIFTEHPGVYQYYKKVVPDKMNEKEFWAKFYKSFFFRNLDPVSNAMTNATSAITKTDVDDPLEFHEREMNKEFDEKSKKMRINPLVNISADDMRNGYGLRNDEMTAPSKLVGFPEMLKNLNRKSARIAQYAFNKSKPGEEDTSNDDRMIDEGDEEKILQEEHYKFKELLDFEDLRTEANVEYIPLKIQDKSRYFEGLLNEPQAVGTISKRVTSYPLQEMKNAFQEELNELKNNLDLSSVIISPHLSNTIYREISNQLKILQESSHDEKIQSGNTNLLDLENKFREVFEVVHELLRHLWGLLALTKTEWKPIHTEKSKKIVDKLNEKQKELQSMSNPQTKQTTNQWTKSLLDSIEVALDNYERRMNPNAVSEQRGFRSVKPAVGRPIGPPSTPVSGNTTSSPQSTPITPVSTPINPTTPLSQTSGGAKKPGPISVNIPPKAPISINTGSLKKPTIEFNLSKNTPTNTPPSKPTPNTTGFSFGMKKSSPASVTTPPPSTPQRNVMEDDEM